MANVYFFYEPGLLLTTVSEQRYDQEHLYVQYTDYAALEANNATCRNYAETLEADKTRLEMQCARLREENKMLKDNLEEIEERARDMAWDRDMGS